MPSPKNTAHLTLKVPPALLSQLDAAASMERRSRASWVRIALEAALARSDRSA